MWHGWVRPSACPISQPPPKSSSPAPSTSGYLLNLPQHSVNIMIGMNAPGVNGVASLSTVWAMMEAARAGASDARSAAHGFLPAVGKTASVCLHSAGYAVAYSVVFPAVFVSRLVPHNNPVVYGLTDGGRAGFDLARSTLSPAAEPQPRLAEATA